MAAGIAFFFLSRFVSTFVLPLPTGGTRGETQQGYSFVQTLDDHSSSITSVRFVLSHGHFQMVSCGADKSLIFRQMQQVSALLCSEHECLHCVLCPCCG